MKKAIFILFLFYTVAEANCQGLFLNEFMASNEATIEDEDGDFSDWIELYNSTNSPINLLNYSLSDDVNELDQWVFPNITIQPNGYLLFFASDKDRLNINELHTNFKISGSGEELFLSDDMGTIIDQTPEISLSDDISYGRIPDGDANWNIINTPSPNATNNNSNNLSFSHQEGFYENSISLSINSLTPDSIYYTLNGDIPTENSALYSNSILIENKNNEPNVLSEIPNTPDQSIITFKAWESPSGTIDKATILRIASYKNGNRTSKIYTKTYFVDDEISEKYTLPIISLITEEENLFSNDSGIYIPGINYSTNNPQWTGNSFMRGSDW